MPGDGKVTSSKKAELRRLMQQRKQDGTQRPKTIDSPLAKYSNSGQLTCVVCRTPVKSELLWSAHLASRSHKERVVALRSQQTSGEKRRSDNTAGSPSRLKRPRDDRALPEDFFEKPQVPKKGILKNAPPLISKSTTSIQPATSQPVQNVETMDTEDSAHVVSNGPSVANSRTQIPGSSADGPELEAGQLPEGFFDDPLKDAKARNVEYRDPAEVEWEKFQREMQTELAESEVILDEDQQEATVGRQIEEVDEQIRNLSRVVSMEKRKEQLASLEAATALAAAAASGGDEPGDSSADEDEVDEFLDWRAKGAWK